MTYLPLIVLTFNASAMKKGSCWVRGCTGKACEAGVTWSPEVWVPIVLGLQKLLSFFSSR